LLECEDTLEQLFSEMKKTQKEDRGSVINWRDLLSVWEKYAALGAFRLKDLGTLEFRHMPGTYNVPKIFGWICLIHRLCESAKEISFKTLMKTVLEINTKSNYTEFQESIFREYSVLFNPFSKENLIDGVSKIKENLYYTPIKKLVSKSDKSGLNQIAAKINLRKKNKEDLSPEEKLKKYLRSEVSEFVGNISAEEEFEEFLEEDDLVQPAPNNLYINPYSLGSLNQAANQIPTNQIQWNTVSSTTSASQFLESLQNESLTNSDDHS